MRLLTRLLQRLLILGLGVFSVWLIVFVVFEFADQRLPWILALGATYGIGAYIILPRVVRTGLKILQRNRVPVSRRRVMGCLVIRSTLRSSVRCNSFAPPLRPPAGQGLIGWDGQARGGWSEHLYSNRHIRPPRSVPFIFSGVARTSASRSQSITALASAIISGSGR